MSSLRIGVFGAGGMLGKAVVAAAESAGHKPYRWTHQVCNIADRIQVAYAFQDTAMDVAINCAGVIPQVERPDKDIAMILVNATGPHILAEWASRTKTPLIHVSTDCVFSGKPRLSGRAYTSEDVPDPEDLYGRSKAVGEKGVSEFMTVVRTSFVGPEHGLMRFLLDNKSGRVEGWKWAYWSGSTVGAVARSLVELAEKPLSVNGIVHLSTQEKISKLEVIEALVARYDLKIKIRSIGKPHIIDRALQPDIVLTPFIEALFSEGL